MRSDRWSRARLDDHIVMSRCEAASDRVRGRHVRPYIVPRDHDADVYLLLETKAKQAGHKVDETDQPNDYLGHPVEHCSDDASDNRNAQNQVHNERGHIEYQADNLADDARHPLSNGDDDPSDHSHHYPCQPAKPFVATEAPPVAIVLLTALLHLIDPCLYRLFNLLLDPVLNVVAGLRPPFSSLLPFWAGARGRPTAARPPAT